jgi:hypothetical protein
MRASASSCRAAGYRPAGETRLTPYFGLPGGGSGVALSSATSSSTLQP